MRRLLLLALIGVVCAGCGGSGSSGTLDAPETPVPTWIVRERLPADAVPGATLFASADCTTCHVYAGSGTSALGAPELTAIGLRRPGIAYAIRHLRCPSCVHPGSPMPEYSSLGPKRLRELAIFLDASKGTH